jgi:hypothetical protein
MHDLWNADGNSGPAVFVLDHLILTHRLASHGPAAVNP